MASNSITLIPSFVRISEMLKELRTETRTQHGNTETAAAFSFWGKEVNKKRPFGSKRGIKSAKQIMCNSLLRLHKGGRKCGPSRKWETTRFPLSTGTSLLLLKHGDSRREGNHSEDSTFEHCSRCRTKYRSIEQSATGGPDSNRARAERIIFKNSDGPSVTLALKRSTHPV